MVQEINTLGAVFKSAFSKNLFGFDPGPRIPEATCLTAGDLEMLDIIIHHKLEIYYKIENSMSPVQSITTVCFVDQTGYRGLGIDLVPRQIGVPARPWIICMLLWCWRKLGVEFLFHARLESFLLRSTEPNETGEGSRIRLP